MNVSVSGIPLKKPLSLRYLSNPVVSKFGVGFLLPQAALCRHNMMAMNLRRYHIRDDYLIELVVLMLMATGTVFVFSAGATVTGQYDWKRFYDFTVLKQILFFPVAAGLMYVFSFLDYRRFSFQNGFMRSLTTWLVVLSLSLLVVVLVFGVERNFSRRWLDLAPGPAYVSFQPSELAKWTVLIFLAAFMSRSQVQPRGFTRFFLTASVVPALAVGLIISEDFGTAAFIALLAFLMLWLGEAVWWHFLVPLPVVLPGFIAAVLISPTRINRIKDFLNPDVISYQAHQSLLAISSGQWFGRGLGRGVLKYGHLPEDTSDFIFSIICEELGFAGAVLVILLFVVFLILGLRVALRCTDPFARLLAAGIVLAIVLQAVINIGVVTVVLPTKGIPLPLISAGGTSMLLTAAAVGILLNIARQASGGVDADNMNIFARPCRVRRYDDLSC